jgi:hypothetical protein
MQDMLFLLVVTVHSCGFGGCVAISGCLHFLAGSSFAVMILDHLVLESFDVKPCL